MSDDLKSRISEFEDMYIEQVINNIKSQLVSIEARTPAEKEACQKASTLEDKRKLLIFEKRISMNIRLFTKLI